jgi:hypothetical protein
VKSLPTLILRTIHPPTSAPVIEPVPTQANEYRLLLVHKDDSLFVINQSINDLPTPFLHWGPVKASFGEEWDRFLRPGQCVTVWKKKASPNLRKGSCELVGNRLERSGPEKFGIRFESFIRMFAWWSVERPDLSGTISEFALIKLDYLRRYIAANN